MEIDFGPPWVERGDRERERERDDRERVRDRAETW